jgi:DNA-binding response OmpR family regulator
MRLPLAIPKILLLDGNDSIRISLTHVLKRNDFEVFPATNVDDALSLIASQKFDVLLSDLHMPQTCDGLAVVRAMRHANPEAITLIFTGYPKMKETAAAIQMQADEILVKPVDIETLIETIRKRLRQGRETLIRTVETVADILEQETRSTIQDWLLRVELQPDIITVSMDFEERCAHLRQMFRDIVSRLRHPLPLGSTTLRSPAAAEYGATRYKQGYSAAMLVEEARTLQVSIFQTLQNNLRKVDSTLLLASVMMIADEVDSQLAQAMASYINEAKADDLRVEAMSINRARSFCA